MTIDVDPDWWKRLFDEVYLVTDARSVGDESITRREVDAVCELLPLEPGHHILDLCGGHGRHTFELYRRGFTNCTLLDYSRKLIEVAETRAGEVRCRLRFIQADARETGLPGNAFDHVIIMGNSLGYSQARDADLRIIREAYRVLRPGGWLLTDVTDGSAVKKGFIPNSWHEIGAQTVVCRQRELRGEAVVARELVLDKRRGLVRDRTYAIRLYDAESLQGLLRRVGFGHTRVYLDFSPQQSGGDCGFMNDRMIAVGRKG